jgi:hypothetical protein
MIITEKNPQARQPFVGMYNEFFKPVSYLLTEQNAGSNLFTIVPTVDLPALYESILKANTLINFDGSKIKLSKQCVSQGAHIGSFTMEFDPANKFYPMETKVFSTTGALRSDYRVTKVGYMSVNTGGQLIQLPYPKESICDVYSASGVLAYTSVSSVKVELEHLAQSEFTIDPNIVDSIYDQDADISISTHVSH